MPGNEEPRLEDVLVDPIVRAMMRRDAVSRVELVRLITEVRERLVPIHSPHTRDKRATSMRSRSPAPVQSHSPAISQAKPGGHERISLDTATE